MGTLTSGRSGGVSYAYAYAPEAESGQLPRRLARRLLSRRVKLFLVGAALTTLVLIFTSQASAPAYLTGSVGTPKIPTGLTSIWDNSDNVEPGGWGGWGLKPNRPNNDKMDPEQSEVVDTTPTPHKPQSYIAPMRPDPKSLPLPKDIVPDFKISSLRAPSENPFPSTRLREIVSPPIPRDTSDDAGTLPLSETGFASVWKGPKRWDGPRGEIKKVQWEGFDGPRHKWESDEEKTLREERREAVKRAFAFAWQGYKDNAWGHDEVRPVSAAPSDPFNGWGASIIDTLDTLLIMDLSDEYNLCRPHINQLNLHWVDGRDWQNGYISEPPPTDDEETPAESWSVERDPLVGLPVFETSIRYLGGLLGAYDLSGDDLLLDRAVDLAGVVGKAFNTESGMPAGRIDPGKETPIFQPTQISIAEAGSMSLEFMRLSQITGNRTWFDLAQRAMDFLDQEIIPKATQSPLVPLYINPSDSRSSIGGSYSFGGLADSYYEYLIKTYKLLGGSPISKVWRKVYEGSIDKAKEVLFSKVDYIPGTPLLTIGRRDGDAFTPELEHLTCFAGAMLGLGAKLLDRPDDMQDALDVTQSCYWLSAATHTGLQPEAVSFYSNVDDVWMNVNVGSHSHQGDVPDGKNTYEDINGNLRWTDDGSEVDSDKDSDSTPRVEKRLKGQPPGARSVVRRGINRPETIESIFYMYRLTGDRKWQDKGWKMFTSWIQVAKSKAGVSSIQDVTAEIKNIRFGDNMESFTFAETFKYHYLLQSEPDLISLDDYVLNTEAHPLIATPDIHSGSSRLWLGAPEGTDLGVRGEGTDVQKWKRLETLQRSGKAASYKRLGLDLPNSGNSGRGMGGGGGDPNHRPKPPAKVQV